MASASSPSANTGASFERMPAQNEGENVVRVILGATVLYLLGYALASFLLDPTSPGPRLLLNLTFLIAPLVATWTLAASAMRADGRARLAWALMSASTGAWTFGQAMWSYYDLNGLVPGRPSLADLGFALTIPFALAGLLIRWRPMAAKWFGVRAVLEGIVLGLCLLITLWALVLKPTYATSPQPFWGAALASSYAVAATAILAVALLILPRVSQMDWRRRTLLGASIALVAAGNAISLVLSSTRSYHIGHAVDLTWIAGFMLLGAFAAYREAPRMAGLRLPDQVAASPHTITYMLICLVIIVAGADVAREGSLDRMTFGAGVLMVLCLVTLQRLGQLDLRHLTGRVGVQAEELARSNSELRLERLRLEQAQAFAGLTEWEWDPDKRAFRLLTDETPDGFLARDAMDASGRVALEDALDAFVRGESEGFDVQVEMQSNEGTRRLRIWSDARSQIPGAPRRGLAQDITFLKEAETAHVRRLEDAAEVRRLRELDSMRATFINMAAHELNTPLTPIKLQLEILRQTTVPSMDALSLKSFQILERNVARLADLVVDLLDSGRLQAGRMKFTFEPVDLDRLAAESVESYQEIVSQAGVALIFESHGQMRVQGDQRRLHEVLDNLLNNAVKFTPAGGVIHVTAEVERDQAIVRIRDNGLGIAAEGLEQLFQPFSQVNRPVRRGDTGSGLGLFIVRGIAQAHGGNVEASSEGEGKGSTFTVRIPLLAQPISAAAKALKPRSPAARPGTS